MTAAELKELEALKAENARMKAQIEAKNNRVLALRVSERKALSVYGLGRFPVTLYKEQWLRLLTDTQIQLIKNFITANDDALATKPV